MKPGIKDQCSCGSGKKYKDCCEGKVVYRSDAPSTDEFNLLVVLYSARRYAELEIRANALIGQYPDSGFAWKLLGAALQMQGKNALQAFQKTADLMPADAEAHFNLGVVQKSLGQLEQAAASYRKALKINPAYAEAHGNLGNVLKDLGKLDDAVASYRSALEIKPGAADAHNNLGTVLKDLGKLDEAIESYRRAIVLTPNYADAYYNLGNVLQSMGRSDEAIASYRRAVEIRPDFVDAHMNLGTSLKDLGQFDEAAACFRRAAGIKPDSAEAFNNLGAVLKDLGQLEDAVASYNRALEINPEFGQVHLNLGIGLHELGNFQDSESNFRRFLALNPYSANAYNILAFSLFCQCKSDEAINHFRLALEIDPNSANIHSNLGLALRNKDQLDEAFASYRRAQELQPQELQHAIHAHLLLPTIPESTSHIAEWRKRFQKGISALMNIPGKLEEPGEMLKGGITFFLAYHNADNRQLMESLCRMFRTRIPELTTTAPHVQGWLSPTERVQRIRVGFLSEFLFDHTIGKHYQGLIRHLDRSRFKVVVIHTLQTKRDTFRQNLDLMADKVLTLPRKLINQQQAVAAEQLDVLFYPDIGMSETAYFLAYARLAPVQATSWGHPNTTGLDTMDYFVSAVTNEPNDAKAFYTERLVCMSRLPCFYYRTPTSTIPKLSKAELGLPVSGNLYGCPQALFKLHPDFDAILAAIVEGDPSGHLILPIGSNAAWTDLLKDRWAKTFPNLQERVEFLPRMSWDRFMATMAQMDVLLDPLHFGSGNTFYDAMVMGTPVVTWPGRFARGRNVAAAYKQMGVADAPIAKRLEDYAPLALALGQDKKRRQALRETSLEAAKRELFEDMHAVREFESFLESAVEAAAKNKMLPSGWQPHI